MNRINSRPSHALFGEPRIPPKQVDSATDYNKINVLNLQRNLRCRKSISQLELETLKNILDDSHLTVEDIHSLVGIARIRALENWRRNGWHCGFEDLVLYLQELAKLKHAA